MSFLPNTIIFYKIKTFTKLFTFYNDTKEAKQLILFVLWKLFVKNCILSFILGELR